jgi:NADH:ubiquinone oxidoreductase subunit 3 (subunit A)
MNPHTMIGTALALIVLGIIVLFVIPWVGMVVGLVGLALTMLVLLGFRQHPARRPGYVARRGSVRS